MIANTSRIVIAAGACPIVGALEERVLKYIPVNTKTKLFTFESYNDMVKLSGEKFIQNGPTRGVLNSVVAVELAHSACF